MHHLSNSILKMFIRVSMKLSVTIKLNSLQFSNISIKLRNFHTNIIHINWKKKKTRKSIFFAKTRQRNETRSECQISGFVRPFEKLNHQVLKIVRVCQWKERMCTYIRVFHRKEVNGHTWYSRRVIYFAVGHVVVHFETSQP